MRRTGARILIIVGCLAIIAGCVETAARPLLSPWDDEAAFGFTDHRVDATHLVVNYTTPYERTSLDAHERGRSVEKIQALAMDIAVWRAAEIAREQGFPALAVTNRRFSTNVQLYNEAPPPRFILASPQGGVRIAQSPQPDFRSAWMQGKAAISVELKGAKGTDEYDVTKTIDRLSDKYKGILVR